MEEKGGEENKGKGRSRSISLDYSTLRIQERACAYLVLRARVLHRDGDPGGDVRQPDGRFRPIDVLRDDAQASVTHKVTKQPGLRALPGRPHRGTASFRL